jgi:hypothetical protein
MRTSSRRPAGVNAPATLTPTRTVAETADVAMKSRSRKPTLVLRQKGRQRRRHPAAT